MVSKCCGYNTLHFFLIYKIVFRSFRKAISETFSNSNSRLFFYGNKQHHTFKKISKVLHILNDSTFEYAFFPRNFQQPTCCRKLFPYVVLLFTPEFTNKINKIYLKSIMKMFSNLWERRCPSDELEHILRNTFSLVRAMRKILWVDK